VAVVAFPSISPTVTKIEAAAAPIVAQLVPLETDVSADVPTIESLVAQLASQTSAILAGAGGSVKVVAN
jgi:hypothetical protein